MIISRRSFALGAGAALALPGAALAAPKRILYLSPTTIWELHRWLAGERGLCIVDDAPRIPYAPTGEYYLTVRHDGVDMQDVECVPAASASEAEFSLVGAIIEYALHGEAGATLYWRCKPELDTIDDGGHGGFSRLLISNKPALSRIPGESEQNYIDRIWDIRTDTRDEYVGQHPHHCRLSSARARGHIV